MIQERRKARQLAYPNIFSFRNENWYVENFDKEILLWILYRFFKMEYF